MKDGHSRRFIILSLFFFLGVIENCSLTKISLNMAVTSKYDCCS